MNIRFVNYFSTITLVFIFLGLMSFEFPSNRSNFSYGFQKLPASFCLPQIVNAKNKYYILSQGNSDFFRNSIHLQSNDFPDTSIVLFEFIPASAIIKKVSQAPLVRSFFGATFSNGKIFIAGGFDKNGKASKTFMEFDIAAKKWTMKPNMNNTHDNLVLECYNDKLYAISTKNSLEIFDLTSNKWQSIGIQYINNSKPLQKIIASSMVDDKIYLFGNDSSFQIYSVSNNTIENGPQMPMNNDFFDVVAYNRRLYLASGANSEGIDKKVYMFNTIDNSWSVAGKINIERCGSGLAYFGGMLLFLGGPSENISNKTQLADDIFIYRPSN